MVDGLEGGQGYPGWTSGVARFVWALVHSFNDGPLEPPSIEKIDPFGCQGPL